MRGFTTLLAVTAATIAKADINVSVMFGEAPLGAWTGEYETQYLAITEDWGALHQIAIEGGQDLHVQASELVAQELALNAKMLSQAGEYLAQTMTINGVPLSDGIYTKQMFERPNTMAEAAFSERTIETLIEMSVAGMADGETVNVVLPRAFMDYGKTLSTLSVQNRKAAHVFQEEYKWYQFPRSYDY
jgi:hypothetical protein